MTIPAYSKNADSWPSVVDADWPIRQATPIAPSDTVAVAVGSAGQYARALYVGVSGDLTVVLAGDTTAAGAGTPVTFPGVAAGYHPIQARMVMATGTTASGIVGLI